MMIYGSIRNVLLTNLLWDIKDIKACKTLATMLDNDLLLMLFLVIGKPSRWTLLNKFLLLSLEYSCHAQGIQFREENSYLQ